MADAIQAFTLTIPGNQSSTVIVSTDCPLGISEVSQIDLVFAPGCSGLVGARVEFAENPVYPIGDNSWFVLDDYVLSIPVSRQGNSGQWRISGYNQDLYQHTVRAYFYYTYVDYAQSSTSLVTL